jgi:type VI secretion system protein ImpG
MRDDLLYYYERELTFLRRMGAEFAQKYPKVASRLMLEPAKCEDPHVERLLEGFAFLAARVHLKLDDDLSEISERCCRSCTRTTLAGASMSIVAFFLDRSRAVHHGMLIPANPALQAGGGTSCRFRTHETTPGCLGGRGPRVTSTDSARHQGQSAAALRLVPPFP